jgi:cytochrome c
METVTMRSPAARRILCVVAATLLSAYGGFQVRADPAADGKTAFAVCSACHSVESMDGLGPHLNGVIGRKAGSVPGFNYSPAMKRSDIVWDAQSVEKFLANPQQDIPGNRMPFAGLQDATARADVAAYLASLH